jgi:hypothetical protein
MERLFGMKNRFFNFAFVFVAIIGLLSTTAFAQTRPRNNAAATAPASLMASLPESDAVVQVKMKQLFREAMPRILASNPARLAQVNASVEDFKNRTGLDPRMFDELAFGAKYTYPGDGMTKVQTVALAKGEFSAAAMVAAGRVASNGKYREEKYHGKTIYIFTLDETVKILGVFDFRIAELAAAPLDANTLALGDPISIRSAIDVTRASRRATNAELIALASRDPNAVIGFGSTMSERLIRNIDIGNAPIATELGRLRQVYGSVSTTEKDLQLFLGARAINAEAAQSLGTTLEGLKQFGALLVGRLSGARGVLAKSALTNLTIVTTANELQIRTAVPQADVGPLMGTR